MSLFSFLKIIAKINKFSHILEYSKNPDLNARMPGYKVKMGFGLHQGWGIEGAIGSYFKIDASYLSPNVNMSARLEAATKQYGVPLLISGDMYEVFTPEIKGICREIDKVTVKGSIQPMRLFTVDINTENLTELNYNLKDMAIKDKKRIRDRERKNLWALITSRQRQAHQIMFADRDFKELREHFDAAFATKFDAAYRQYLGGDWKQSHDGILECLQMTGHAEDGPCLTIKSILEEGGCMAPSDWPGYRALTEK